MTNKKESVQLADVCKKLHRSVSTLRRYLRDYADVLDIDPNEMSGHIPRNVATQLTLIRDLKHARLRHEDILKVLRAIKKEELWPQIGNWAPLLKEQRDELLGQIEALGMAPAKAETDSKKALKTGLQITRDTIAVAGLLLALKALFDAKKESAHMEELSRMLEQHMHTYNSDTRKFFELLQEQNRTIREVKNIISPLRHAPRVLSEEQVKKMLKNRGFYDRDWNPGGFGLNHDYEKIRRHGKVLVRDHATGLIWQQSGSSEYIKGLKKAKAYVRELNWAAYAGYTDWRLPTLEEAMSLMERTEKNGDLYIDPDFDKKQRWIWTCDTVQDREARAWVVSFSYGSCGSLHFSIDYYCVRAVRS